MADTLLLEDKSAFLDLVRTRRSIRNYKTREVENHKFYRMMEAARMAPSWGNRQCWHFVVVKDRRLLGELAEAATSGAYKLNFWIRSAPAIIAACADPKKSKKRHGIPYYVAETAIAAEHAVLMATEIGLGTCWVGGFDERKVKKILRVPTGHRVVGLITVGYPEESDESFMGIKVINDFGEYYDKVRAKYQHGKRKNVFEIFSYNIFSR